MKPIDAVRLQLKAMVLVEGTTLKWEDTIRHKHKKEALVNPLGMYYLDDIELALGIIEGKPVWEGDELYFTYDAVSVARHVIHKGHDLSNPNWSWLPPTSRTAPVYLLVEDINDAANWNCKLVTPLGNRIAKACRKTLEGLE